MCDKSLCWLLMSYCENCRFIYDLQSCLILELRVSCPAGLLKFQLKYKQKQWNFIIHSYKNSSKAEICTLLILIPNIPAGFLHVSTQSIHHHIDTKVFPINTVKANELNSDYFLDYEVIKTKLQCTKKIKEKL